MNDLYKKRRIKELLMSKQNISCHKNSGKKTWHLIPIFVVFADIDALSSYFVGRAIHVKKKRVKTVSYFSAKWVVGVKWAVFYKQIS